MKPGRLFLSSLLFLACKAHSQQGPTVFSASGGKNNTATLSLEWTMGEPLVTSASTSSRLLTQGFHQPVIIIKKAPQQNNVATLFVTSVFPNPVQSILNVKISSGVTGAISLVNLQGNVLYAKQVSIKNSTVQINMGKLLPAIYLLNVRDQSGKIIETHKVVKVN